MSIRIAALLIALLAAPLQAQVLTSSWSTVPYAQNGVTQGQHTISAGYFDTSGQLQWESFGSNVLSGSANYYGSSGNPSGKYLIIPNGAQRQTTSGARWFFPSMLNAGWASTGDIPTSPTAPKVIGVTQYTSANVEITYDHTTVSGLQNEQVHWVAVVSHPMRGNMPPRVATGQNHWNAGHVTITVNQIPYDPALIVSWPSSVFVSVGVLGGSPTANSWVIPSGGGGPLYRLAGTNRWQHFGVNGNPKNAIESQPIAVAVQSWLDQ